MSDSYRLRQAKFGSVVLRNLHVVSSAYAVFMGFGERLASLRKRFEMTQQELGRGLGTGGADVGKQVIYGWEKDQHYPRVDQLMLICKKLNCSADYLLFGDTAEASPNLRLAQQAVKSLTDKERLALFAAIAQPAVPDAEVEKILPAAPEFKAPPAMASAVAATKPNKDSNVSDQNRRMAGQGNRRGAA